jgi:hypothetical protein
MAQQGIVDGGSVSAQWQQQTVPIGAYPLGLCTKVEGRNTQPGAS